MIPETIGGEAMTSHGGNLYSFGGSISTGASAPSYKFDGTSWTMIAALPIALNGATAVSDGTNIHILGGFDASGSPTSTHYRYDPVANSYSTLAPVLTATGYHSSAYLGGKIYKFCGTRGSIFFSTALDIYDVASDSWTAGASYPLPLFGTPSAFVRGAFIYAAGGHGVAPAVYVNKTYRYNPAVNSWDDGSFADLPDGRNGAVAASYYNGGVLAGGNVGELQGTISASVLFWDPASNTWSNLPDMPGARTGAVGGVLNGSVYVIGGSSMAGGTNDNQKLTCILTTTPTPTPTVTPTPTPTPTPAPSPTPASAQALNISTRMRVETGNNVLIGGFIVTGTAPKNVAARGIGPSLIPFGVPDALTDPTLELHDNTGALLAQSDNWQDNPSHAAQLSSLGLALQDPAESGIVALLQPGAYTAVLAGKNGGTGVGLVEIYDVNQQANSQLANISTRGFVLTGTNVMIGGFILGGANDTHVVARGIGPSLAQIVSPVLVDPTIELHNSNGALLVSNDNWQDDSASAAQLVALGLAPHSPAESGIYVTLSPGAFTAILAGKDGGTGIGLIEIYNVH